MQTTLNPPETSTNEFQDQYRHLAAIENQLADRADILAAITFHETQLAQLRSRIPNAVKEFFRFRCKPEQFVWVYASSREQADARLRERMNEAYPLGWNITSQVVDHYTDPRDASANMPGSLFRSLTDSEAREFLADWRENQKGRVEVPRLKDVAKPQLELDADAFERYLRQQVR